MVRWRAIGWLWAATLLTRQTQAALESEEVEMMVNLSVAVDWMTFHSFDPALEILSGTLGIQMVWNETETAPLTEDMRDMVEVYNFATGSPGRVKSVIIEYYNGLRDATYLLVGNFKQHINGVCYPFDKYDVKFKLGIRPPLNKMVQLGLHCLTEEPKCHAFNSQDQAVVGARYSDAMINHVVKTKRPPEEGGADQVGFDWHDLVCVLDKNRYDIECTMVGERIWLRQVKQDMLPGIIMMIVGFAAFKLPVALTMPRVAVTMIALLTFVSKGIHVLKLVPPRGISWVEEFYLLGMFVMLLNMVGHIAAFQSQAQSKIVDSMSSTMLFWLMLLWLFVSLLVRRCEPLLTGVFETIMTSICAVMVVATIAYMILRYRRSRATDKKNESADADPGVAAVGPL